MTSLAIVTGGNKGIGYAIVKGLCQKFKGDVFLTARDDTRGNNAVENLKNEFGFTNLYFHPLDITNRLSIEKLRDFIKSSPYEGIDILINNAAIAYPMECSVDFAVQAEETLRVNYYGVKDTCDVLFPLLKPHARVVNMSSSAGHLYRIPSEELRKKFASDDLTKAELDKMMDDFVQSAKTGKHVELGYPNSAYAVSKVGLTALTRIQQREFSGEDIVINAIHPGYVDTDMTNHKGFLTIDQGAEAPLFAALLPKMEGKIRGAYIWNDKRVVDWTSPLK